MVLTRYKEDAPRAEDKPRRELSVMEWLEEMAKAGFDGEFLAVKDDMQYKGVIFQAKGLPVVKARRVPKPEEVRERLKNLQKGVA